MSVETDTPLLTPTGRLRAALPFWASLGLIPLVWLAAAKGGFFIALVPLSTWWLFIALDAALGTNPSNLDPQTEERQLRWYRLVTLVWTPLQLLTVYGVLFWLSRSDHLTAFQEWAVFAAIGILSGTIGINYSHELMHQRNRGERWLADILLASVLYSHFRSEHLLVHHRHVGTPRDPVTARYGEGFWRFFPRVLRQSLASAFHAEAAMLARKDLPWWHRRNPFWRYWALQGGFLLLALLIGGGWGLFLFLTQAFWAIFQLELVNYVEHYGLTRRHLGDGRYEHVLPRHSWNADHQASNWLLINLQRHSDHHYKPDRRFPLLQTYADEEAPQLPYGYPVMTLAALVPPLWRRVMNPRVRAWRARHYPDITDWRPYNKALNPPPR
ncbi:alkane 1-monooxygenase [Wenxinia marina]|uniref:Alkane 1-monooxygenase n=1 Tax=Wenxinia marina DSM 24838 TaxID=1123501 RepID=A0A0D0PII3_9RHOB|nr:alkane 1-monooxygenase [Wenxinia marina]KIQ71166.1 alkane 1-monooxygenase [Wenxinia marina DSM 24838]GGL54323.1 alkane 1-monooxygenase [Wenxinia marina]